MREKQKNHQLAGWRFCISSTEILPTMNTPSIPKSQEEFFKSSEVPKFKCWIIGRTPDGTKLVSGICPFCRGLHRHGSPRHHLDRRVAHCSENAFSKSEASRERAREYALDLQSGKAPRLLLRALKMPVGDLSAAQDRIGEHARGFAFVEGKNEAVSVPSREDTLAALSALKRCGAADAAAHLKASLSSEETRVDMRRMGSNWWLSEAGVAMRAAILKALRDC